MAVTIYDEPQLISPAGNPLVFTFSSDQTAQVNFSFMVEIYINGLLRITQEVFRQFNTLARIDVSEAVQSTLSNIRITTDLEYDATDSMVEYYIIVYEKYGATPTIQDSDTSSTLKAINAALEYDEWVNWDYTIYDPNLTQDAIFMTYFPTSKRALCGMEENFFLGYLEQSAVVPVVLNVRLYNVSSSLIASDSISLTSTDFNILNVGPQQIIANSSITQIDFDDCYRYEVEVDVSGVSLVGPFTIYMDLDCKRYDTYRLHWLNKFGAFDSFTFSLVSTDAATVQSYGYQRDPGVWDGTSYTYPLYAGQAINFAKTKTETLTLNSDWINEQVQQWLVKSLFDSPVVYLEVNDSTNFEIVKVTNSNYTLKQRRRDGLIQEVVNIDRTFTYRSQLN
jgi:hypothetical protein